MRHLTGIVPGLLLSGLAAASAFGIRQLPGIVIFSPMIIAVLIGMLFHNTVGTPPWARKGVAFTQRHLLRIAVVLLGLQLTVAQAIEVGGRGLAVIAATLLGSFWFTIWMGRLLNVERKLTQLIAAGTSICGASAIVATNTVVRAQDEDVAYAVSSVTIFGSIAIFVYPVLSNLLQLDPHSFGLWSGASIHEIAQVVAAAFQGGQQAGEFATIAKLSRIMLLAPMVLAMGHIAARGARRRDAQDGIKAASVPMPWFVLGFVALVCMNSVVAIPPDVRTWLMTLTTFLLSVALAAMGLETDIGKLVARGFRPALLGALAFVFIAGFSLTLIKLAGYLP